MKFLKGETAYETLTILNYCYELRQLFVRLFRERKISEKLLFFYDQGRLLVIDKQSSEVLYVVWDKWRDGFDVWEVSHDFDPIQRSIDDELDKKEIKRLSESELSELLQFGGRKTVFDKMVGELEEINDNEALIRDMEQNGAWYQDGERIDAPRFIALGRREWYVDFAEKMTRTLGVKVWLLDFMNWISDNPYKSLLYYIKSATRIDVSLKGITYDDLVSVTKDCKGLLGEVRLKYMTLWEINQLYFRDILDNTYWHSSDTISKIEIYEALKSKVKSEKIS